MTWRTCVWRDGRTDAARTVRGRRCFQIMMRFRRGHKWVWIMRICGKRDGLVMYCLDHVMYISYDLLVTWCMNPVFCRACDMLVTWLIYVTWFIHHVTYNMIVYNLMFRSRESWVTWYVGHVIYISRGLYIWAYEENMMSWLRDMGSCSLCITNNVKNRINWSAFRKKNIFKNELFS